MSASEQQHNIGIISMPWALFNRPSIQLGTLKSYIEENSTITVQCYHPYVAIARNIGVDNYRFLSKNGWAGDALYAALLFPEMKAAAQKLFKKVCKNNSALGSAFDSIANTLGQALDQWTENTDLSNSSLIGFSVCFNQLFSSLLAARKIKQKYPHIEIVFGGSSCVGEMGNSIIDQFDQVDYAIGGEGEQQLLDLCNSFFGMNKSSADHGDVPLAQSSPRSCSVSLNSLPTPDYHPYFEELKRHFPGTPFSPRVPLEFSRGCWWRKCTFCNLNLQWHGYRLKPAAKVVEELQQLHNLHNCLDYTFCDNALPEKETDEFFEAVQKLGIDFNFFAEIRPLKDPYKLKLYHEGGLTSVQVGIESFANSLLKKMAKGTTVIENLAIMKYCAAHCIRLDGNLIIEFPGSTSAEVSETLKNLDFAYPFNPLETATFFLGTGSPVDKAPTDYGIRSIAQHKNYRQLFPPYILKNMHLLIRDYQGDKTLQRRLWRPVRKKVREWQNFHKKRNDPSLAPLSYRDGGSFIIIRQERPDNSPLLHRLHGTSRKLYLFCNTIQSLDNILLHFSGLQEKALLSFFHDLNKKKLLFQENKHFLALAVRER